MAHRAEQVPESGRRQSVEAATLARHALCLHLADAKATIRRREPMMNAATRLLRDENGQDIAEYGLAIAVVALLAVTASIAISANVRTLWTRALQTLIIAALG